MSSTCFGRAARRFSADQREAHCARVPSYIFHRRLALLPSALFVEFSLRCQLGVLNLERALPSRTRTGYRCFAATSILARVAVTRTRRLGSNPVRQLSSFAPAVNYDCAMARTLRRLPRADEVESPAFAQRPQQPSFFRVCHHFRPGAGPSASDPY